MKNTLKKILKAFEKIEQSDLWVVFKVQYIRATKIRRRVISNDPKTYPIIIISFNQLYYLKELIERLQTWGYKNIVIIDNNSKYNPLIQYLEEIKGKVVLHKLKKNYGHMVFWKRKEFRRLYGTNYYVITDPDIVPDDQCPSNFLSYFREVLDQNPQVTKVGFSLKLKDIPDTNPLKEKILKWENKFRQRKDDGGNFLAEIDTTFALYRPHDFMRIEENFYNAIRTKEPYIAKHGGWYIDIANLSPEQKNYMRTAGVSSSWRIDEDGINNHPSY